MTYVVSREGKIIRGPARKILQKIIDQDSSIKSDIDGMTVDEYATTLIQNAHLFLSNQEISEINKSQFASDYDRALNLLSAMPSSSTRIIRTN